MTTLQLNRELFQELSIISNDKNKLIEAIKALRNIARGVRHSPAESSKTYIVKKQDSNLAVTDEDWDDYFANTPAVDLPAETDTHKFVQAAKGRTINQMKPWL